MDFVILVPPLLINVCLLSAPAVFWLCGCRGLLSRWGLLAGEVLLLAKLMAPFYIMAGCRAVLLQHYVPYFTIEGIQVEWLAALESLSWCPLDTRVVYSITVDMVLGNTRQK